MPSTSLVFQLGAKRLKRVAVQPGNFPAALTMSRRAPLYSARRPSFCRANISVALVSTTSLPAKPAFCSCRMRWSTVSEPARYSDTSRSKDSSNFSTTASTTSEVMEV